MTLSEFVLGIIVVLPDKLSLASVNTIARFLGKPSRFGFDDKHKLFYTFSHRTAKRNTANKRHYFSNKYRGFGMYFHGLQKRGHYISKTYELQSKAFLDYVDKKRQLKVVEIGPNGSDLSLWLRNISNDIQLVCFEPSPKSHESTSLNIIDLGACFQVALGDTEGTASFYVSERNGDSSLFVPSEPFEEQIAVQVRRLDAAIVDTALAKGKIDLMKVEAEGFEPEVLRGGVETLKRTRWVALDGGPEPGRIPQQTFERSANILFKFGFQLVSINFRDSSGRALFERV